jgi:hypothetical protein
MYINKVRAPSHSQAGAEGELVAAKKNNGRVPPANIKLQESTGKFINTYPCFRSSTACPSENKLLLQYISIHY